METKKSEIEHQYENSLFSAYLTGQQSVRDKLDGRKPRDFTSWYKEGGHNFANSRINQQTTSQQQTIERLRELVYKTNVDEIKSTMFSETIVLAGHRYEFVEGAKWMLEYFKRLIKSEQLLNTKEPIDQ